MYDVNLGTGKVTLVYGNLYFGGRVEIKTLNAVIQSITTNARSSITY